MNEKSTDDLVHSFVGRFNVVLHHNTKYFATFVACEMLNVVVLFVNFYSANEFLGGKFSAYGFEVVKYYNLPSSLRYRTPAGSHRVSQSLWWRRGSRRSKSVRRLKIPIILISGPARTTPCARRSPPRSAAPSG